MEAGLLCRVCDGTERVFTFVGVGDLSEVKASLELVLACARACVFVSVGVRVASLNSNKRPVEPVVLHIQPRSQAGILLQTLINAPGLIIIYHETQQT